MNEKRWSIAAASACICLAACTTIVVEEPEQEVGVSASALCEGQVCYASEFGADPEPGNDDTEALQMAIHHAIVAHKPLEIEVGVYDIYDTLFIGGNDDLCAQLPGGNCTFISAVIRGENAAYVPDATVLILTNFSQLDRPAINIQGARDVKLSNIRIQGQNFVRLNPALMWDSSIEPDEDAWVCSTCSANQHSPYAGIAVDGYSGTPPADAYPTTRAQYGPYHSSFIEMDDVWVQDFVAGVAIKPSDDINMSDAIVMRRVNIQGAAYGLAIGSEENRSILFEGGSISMVHTAVTTRRFGKQLGQAPHLADSLFGHAVRLFDLANGSGHISMDNLHAERFATMGNFGGGALTSSHPASIRDSNFAFFDYDNYKPAFLLESWTPLDLSSVALLMQGIRPFSFFVGHTGSVLRMSGSTFTSTGWATNPGELLPFEAQLDGDADTMSEGSKLIGNAPSQDINSEAVFRTLPTRHFIASHTRRVFEESTGKAYTVAVQTRELVPVTKGFTIGANDVTFVTNEPETVRVGDWMYWRAQSQWMYDSHPSYAGMVAGLRITAVDAVTGTVTAVPVIDDLIGPGDPATEAYARIMRPAFINATTATATVTGSSTTVTLDDPQLTSNFQVGDWIKGSGLPARTRIAAIDTVNGTLTLTKAAQAGGTGVEIYNTQLVP